MGDFMADERLSTAERSIERLARDDDDQQRSTEPSIADESNDAGATSAARRRASLDKEIRAGWQRALGH